MLAFPPICLIICSVSVTHTQLFCEPFKDILHVMVLYPQILQCIFPKTRNILFHNHSAVINFIIHFDVFHLIQSTIHILILPVDLILSFVAFPPTQYRIQSRMRYYNQLSHLFNLLYLEHFPQPFFLFYLLYQHFKRIQSHSYFLITTSSFYVCLMLPHNWNTT